MYNEIIYTRCGAGVDLLRQGAILPNEGLKVYAVSQEVFGDGSVEDFPFLARALQTPQSYSDPAFMEDAFLYYVPERGAPFLVNFHPTPYEPNLGGSFSNRPGHFINQAFAGDFTQAYPCDFILQKDIWDAQTRGVAYYYETPSTHLPQRDLLANGACFEKAGAFIAEGREDALKSAVAFLVTQYGLPPQERKFLVIKDEDADRIALWIAAIECAFSPALAAQIPFATRMDKFIAANRYTVDGNGMFCPQINLQDTNQTLRYRAMIVGVDSRDAANARALQEASANAAFVVLDGMGKRALFSADTSDPYYDVIARFDDAHRRFCQEVLPAYGIRAIGGDVLWLYGAWRRMNRPEEMNAVSTARDVHFLSDHCAMGTQQRAVLFANVRERFPSFVRQNAEAALSIAGWLTATEPAVGQTGAMKMLEDVLGSALIEATFQPGTPSVDPLDLWGAMANTAYATPVARRMTEERGHEANVQAANALPLARLVTLCKLSGQVDAHLGNQEDAYADRLFAEALNACYRQHDQNAAGSVLSAFVQEEEQVQSLLFPLLRTLDTEAAAFVVDAFLAGSRWVIPSNDDAVKLHGALCDAGCGEVAGQVFVRRLDQLYAAEYLGYLGVLSKVEGLDSQACAAVLEKMDETVRYAEEMTKLAGRIQAMRPPQAKCPRSACLCLLNDLEKKNKGSLRQYQAQGLRMFADASYCKKLIAAIAKAKLYEHEHLLLLTMFSDKDEPGRMFMEAYAQKLAESVSDGGLGFASLMTVISRRDMAKNRPRYKECIIQALADGKLPKKTMADIEHSLHDKEARDLYHEIINAAAHVRNGQLDFSRRGQAGGFLAGLLQRKGGKRKEGKNKRP